MGRRTTYAEVILANPDTPLTETEEQYMVDSRHLEDGCAAVDEPLDIVNLSDDPAIECFINISAQLTTKEKARVTKLLKEYQEVFAWSYEDMPGLDPNMVCHALNIQPGAKPIKQPKRGIRPSHEQAVKAEVEKLITSGFIKPIQHPTWLSNIVTLDKKNGGVRVCIDFRDLNNACPKDDFPLPNMDALIDSNSSHKMLSFMDGFSGYNQIKMSSRDATKIAFRTSYGNFYYTVMPFGLKNAGATYQRAMTAIFHDMMGNEVEDYVDDLVIKSKTRQGYWEVLRKVLERCKRYNLCMNPKKCTFGVLSGKFLGFIVHHRGIDVDPAKTRGIVTLSPPQNQKELKSLSGKLSYIRRFIPGLAALTTTFMPLLKKGVPFTWNEQHSQMLEKI